VEGTKDDATIFGTAAGMFPSPCYQVGVYRAANDAAVSGLRGREPRVDHETCPRIKLVWLRGEVDVVNRVQQRCCRDLGRLLAAPRAGQARLRGHRVHGHAVRHVGDVCVAAPQEGHGRERFRSTGQRGMCSGFHKLNRVVISTVTQCPDSTALRLV
jgi:hypothetical protein